MAQKLCLEIDFIEKKFGDCKSDFWYKKKGQTILSFLKLYKEKKFIACLLRPDFEQNMKNMY